MGFFGKKETANHKGGHAVSNFVNFDCDLWVSLGKRVPYKWFMNSESSS